MVKGKGQVGWLQSNLGLNLCSSPYGMHDLEQVTPRDSVSAPGKSQQTLSFFLQKGIIGVKISFVA